MNPAPIAVPTAPAPRYTVAREANGIMWRIFENGEPTTLTGSQVDATFAAAAMNEQRARFTGVQPATLN